MDYPKSEVNMRIQVITSGGVAQKFEFSHSNLFSTPKSLHTTAPLVPSPREPDAIAVSHSHTAVTLTETPPPNAWLTGAACTDAQRSRTGNPPSFGILNDQTLTVPAAYVLPGADITCVFSHEVRSGMHGLLFNDDGAGDGTANDGILNGAESGWSGGAVSLTNCAGLTYGHSTSDAAGRFVLAMPPRLASGAALCLQSARVVGRQPTGASVDSTPLAGGSPVDVAGTAYRYGRGPFGARVDWVWRGAGAPEGASVQLGSVPAARFVDAGVVGGRAGDTVTHAHVLTSGTAASIHFSIPRAFAVPPTPGWAERIFADPGCTGRLQAGADRLYPPASPRTLAAGERFCIVLQETIPTGAPIGSRNTTSVQATLAFSNAGPTGLSESVVLDDITTVIDTVPPVD